MTEQKHVASVGMKLIKYLETKGHSKNEINELLQQKRISVFFAGRDENRPHVATEEDLEIGYGDKIYVKTESRLKTYHHRAFDRRQNETQRLELQTQGLKLWWRVAGASGFILGGPLSGFLAYVAAKVLIEEEARKKSKGSSKNIAISPRTFYTWVAIGSLALPASWWITKSLGWNQDILALVQSQGRFKSYKDWDVVNKQKREQENAIEDQRRRRENSSREAQYESNRRKEEQIQKKEEQLKIQRSYAEEKELKSITEAIIAMDLDRDKFSRSSTTCSRANSLMSRLETLKEKRGVLNFNFWDYQTDMRDTSDSDWNGGAKQRGYIVNGKINAYELMASVDDYIKTCDAMSVLP